MLRKHIERIVNFPVTTIKLAIFATTFFAYQFKNLHMEGFLVPLAMTTSSLATLILLPAMVRLIKPGFIYK